MPTWSADLAGQQVLLPSGLGFSELPRTGFSLQKTTRSEHHGSWKPVYGERNSIPDNFRELQIILTAPSEPRIEVDLRAYDEGFALRYRFPDHHAREMLKLGKENTEFHLPSGTFAYEKHNTVRRAAEHHLMLNVHDQFRPSGYTRTYPNLLTVEGIRGNEYLPTAAHDATIPFTRYLAGSADYTICYFDPRLKNTHAHQLAMTVISYSPVQSVFWYDKLSAYQGESEVRWFEQVPTVWDDTRVVAGEIGLYAAEARRSGTDWFVGIVNGMNAREMTLPLNFLNPGRRYEAELYTDDASIQTRTHVRIATQKVTSSTVLTLPLLDSGGAGIHITQLP